MNPSASALEITWTVIAMIALGFSAWILDDNVRNMAAVRRAVKQERAVAWGPRWWVALASLVSSAAMLVVWIGFAVIGVLAMTVSPGASPALRATVSSFSGWILVGMTLILAAIQAWQVYARTHILPIENVAEQPESKP